MSAATAPAMPVPAFELPAAWVEIAKQAPQLGETMTAYLDDLSGRLAPASVAAAEVSLRQFALHVIATDGSCRAARDVSATLLGTWCAELSDRSTAPPERSVTARTINYKLDILRRFFEHICESGYPDAPTEIPIVRQPRPPRPPRSRRATMRTRLSKPRAGKRIKTAGPKPPSRALPRETTWEEIAARAPQMVATMTAYLEQISVSHRSTSVEAYSLALRHLAARVTASDPTCQAAADITRTHIEDYKLALAAHPGRKGVLSKTTIRHNLGMVRTFFERIIDWDWDDAPRRVPIFAGDVPKADEPLPKFLDDPTAAKFMATLATDPDRRRRLLVELLARTGMRAGELGGLRDDAMYRVGDTWWLRIPIGKLHNDRNVPLHPLLVGLITDYQARRGPSRNGFLLERDDGQPFDRRTVHRYVATVARRASVARVHPHQLRHTLATQCLNRGMSLEAIAALLGHRSPRMTLVYARISDTNVADQYFKATQAVEADSATAPTGQTSQPAGTHRRLLANGHCTRPLELDCRFQTICEGCGFYQTGAEFVDILRRQRDDATAHADMARGKLYHELVRVIDASP
ncbi:MAG TPA: tyrosine-type recombinase/integrase [Acidimicrobiales bacterium]|nr:tyrosine-type recombinase/integrase [Acidimicrobiales bacterium]